MIHEVDAALLALDRARGGRDRGTSRWSSTRPPRTGPAGATRPPSTSTSTTSARTCAAASAGCSTSTTHGRVTARHLPPRFFKLSYLVTAWTQRPEDEHRLLSSLLACFLRHEALPAELLTGPLAELGLPCR